MSSLVEVTGDNFPTFQWDILEIERTSFPSPWDLKSFSSEIDRSISHLWTLLIDEVLKGYICFWIFANETHLMNIAVHPEWRGKGLGEGLLCKMIEVGISEGAKTAWLEVRPSNLVARSLYEKAGFKEVGFRPRYYKETNEDAIIMSLPLLSA
ncbi:MAG: ribosomal protein S18-alanine N-acetyltransferase [Deltaproteobacteria bacterium]|uniref:[Ribosomal protein bS18]-alanine N-acetyltransferase n=1 Tax=Candidatus Desulfacyla euxinica TaxID=2841693 RepID=A0A8J6N570_9DELT|nr:ribosomal protein S18-alanine N-acetyltransferase [Candidatus Desulfacyla euxinica]MBL7216833.1 ribosomal protein S18-alanine N-acetyltransferase [Desulfobacteraceae bacterium]MBW1868466.1 ribosomal protein S18-alanine N-acetyltransferase [Deltaproteobacteria bacterium]MBW2203364.1 ribosomal protein S18-alanine N-acetyltransferase [Deltaproteobacteria bacterium]